MAQFWVYVGTITTRDSKGIYLYRLDAASGELEAVGLAAELPNPTFLAIHPQGRFLYSVTEFREAGGRHDGSVSAFSIAPKTGRLTFLNRQSSCGAGPCHVSVDPAGRFAFAANYGSGGAVMFPIQGDGRLGAATGVVQHHGSSVNPKRQSGPHAHSITPSPDGRFALVADLGTDRIMVYRLDVSTGGLLPNDPPYAAIKPGAGPRHLAFHSTRPFVYLINELDNTMTVFAWDAPRGALRELQAISTLPQDFHGINTCADVHVAPSGRFLYGSNRGHDSIAIFRINESSGTISALGHQSVLGKGPRNFAIDPTGGWLLAANTGRGEGSPVADGPLPPEDECIVAFRIDSTTGQLSPTGRKAALSVPSCVKLLAQG